MQMGKAATVSVLTGMAILAMTASPALALYVFDPPWVQNPNDPQWQGGSTTSQTWEFGHNHVIIDNQFGQPGIQFPNGSPSVVIDFPGYEGIEIPTWHIDQEGGGMLIYIPNDPEPRPRKVIHLQYTSDKASTGAPVTNPPGTASAGGVAQAGVGSAWYTYEWTIEIQPNPASETIWVPFPVSTDIEEVTVQTICVPEPATLGLLTICGLVLVRRRK